MISKCFLRFSFFFVEGGQWNDLVFSEICYWYPLLFCHKQHQCRLHTYQSLWSSLTGLLEHRIAQGQIPVLRTPFVIVIVRYSVSALVSWRFEFGLVIYFQSEIRFCCLTIWILLFPGNFALNYQILLDVLPYTYTEWIFRRHPNCIRVSWLLRRYTQFLTILHYQFRKK